MIKIQIEETHYSPGPLAPETIRASVNIPGRLDNIFFHFCGCLIALGYAPETIESHFYEQARELDYKMIGDDDDKPGDIRPDWWKNKLIIDNFGEEE